MSSDMGLLLPTDLSVFDRLAESDEAKAARQKIVERAWYEARNELIMQFTDTNHTLRSVGLAFGMGELSVGQLRQRLRPGLKFKRAQKRLPYLLPRSDGRPRGRYTQEWRWCDCPLCQARLWESYHCVPDPHWSWR